MQFQAASGRILSPERSRELIAQLANGGEGADVLARHLALEQAVADSPLVLGNRVVILENGPRTYASDVRRDRRGARPASTWRPTSSRTTRSASSFADALIAKQARRACRST